MPRIASLIVAGAATLLFTQAIQAQTKAPTSQPGMQVPKNAAGTRPSTAWPSFQARGVHTGSRSGTNAVPSEERRLQSLVEEVGLTPEQQMQARVILQQYGQQAGQTRDSHQRLETMQAAWEKIEDTILTDKQREKLAEGRYVPQRLEALQSLKLTADQQKQLKEILDKARADVAKIDSVAGKREIWQKALAQISTQVLTEEQHKQWSAARHKR